MLVDVNKLQDRALDWAVATCKGMTLHYFVDDQFKQDPWLSWSSSWSQPLSSYSPSTDWSQGGPIIERENITVIRANSDYIDGKHVPKWFAETDKWVGHNITTSHEGEHFDPCFMIDEAGGFYGPTPLIAAMRCYVKAKMGDTIDVPEELC